MQAEKTNSNFIASILRKDEAEPREAIKDSRPAIPTPMLDVVFKSGAIVSFAYAYLVRVTFDPKGRIDARFGDDVLVIEGRNLSDIRQKLRLHKADEIQEGSETEGQLKPEASAHIERIQILKEEEVEREANAHNTGKRKGLER